MRKIFLLPVIIALLLFVGNTANACPKTGCYEKEKITCEKSKCEKSKCSKSKCEKSKCSKSKCKKSKCKCGETCKYVKECKKTRVCEYKKFYNYKYKSCGCGKVRICHEPPGNVANMHTICISKSAVSAHLKHGDRLGKCLYETKKVCTDKKCCKYVKKCECNKCKCKKPDAGPCKTCDAGPCPTCDGGPVEPDGGPTPDSGPLPDSGPIPDIGPLPDSEPTPDLDKTDMEVIVTDSGCAACPDGAMPKEKKEKKDDLVLMGGGCSMNTDGNPYSYVGFIFIAILLLIGMLKKSKMIVVLSIVFLAANTYAYDNDYNVTEGGKVLNHLTPEIGLKLDYARRPAQILKKSNHDRVTDTIAHTTKLSLNASMGFWDRLEVGITVPFELSQRTTGLQYLGEDYTTELDSGLGNLVLLPKLRLVTLGDNTLFHIGLIGPVELPTMTYNSRIGYNAPAFSPQLVLELDTRYVDAAINVGYSFRMDNSLVFRNQNVNMDDALVGSVGVKFAVIENKMEIVGDSFFSMDISEQDEEEVPVEILGGLRFYFPRGFQVDVGAGAGLTKGIGAPTYRLIAGISWSPEKPKVVKEYITKIVEKKCPVCPKVVKNTILLPPLFFDFDKDYLTATSLPVMEFIVKTLYENPHIDKIAIDGHTDSKGSNKYNVNLGMRRAKHVKNLLETRGLKFEVRLVSFSEDLPYTTNKTDSGRAQNRRVELHIIR